jgi:hypothetical protein
MATDQGTKGSVTQVEIEDAGQKAEEHQNRTGEVPGDGDGRNSYGAACIMKKQREKVSQN